MGERFVGVAAPVPCPTVGTGLPRHDGLGERRMWVRSGRLVEVAAPVPRLTMGTGSGSGTTGEGCVTGWQVVGDSRALPAPHRGYRVSPARRVGRTPDVGKVWEVDGGSRARTPRHGYRPRIKCGETMEGTTGEGCMTVWQVGGGSRALLGPRSESGKTGYGGRERRIGGMADVGKGWRVGGDSRVARAAQGRSRTAPTGVAGRLAVGWELRARGSVWRSGGVGGEWFYAVREATLQPLVFEAKLPVGMPPVLQVHDPFDTGLQ